MYSVFKIIKAKSIKSVIYGTVLLNILSFISAEKANEMEFLQDLVKEWVDVRSEIAAERLSWNNEKKKISRELELIHIEVESLQHREKLLNEFFENRRDRIKRLKKQKEIFQNVLEKIVPLINSAEKKVVSFQKILPSKYVSKFEEHYLKIADKKSSFSQQFNSLSYILKEILKLQESVHMYRELIELKDCGKREFDVVAFGLSLAFFISSDNTIAGYGLPSEEGWLWFRRDNLSDKVKKIINIYNQKISSEYVFLPFFQCKVK